MASYMLKMKALCSRMAQGKMGPTIQDMGHARDVFLAEEPIVMDVNGQTVTVDTRWATAQTSLARYLRTYLGLTGTKIMCAQAGCGSCVVTATHVNPASGEETTHSVNSCITPVFKCNGWKITTVEGLGSTRSGLGELQQRLNDNAGTQCGFCTPGMIMSMNSLLRNNSAPAKEEVKEVLDGNICRCTGYRPIFDAFLSFSGDEDPVVDIEELITEEKRLKCLESPAHCSSSCKVEKNAISPVAQMQFVDTVDGQWIKPETLDDLLALLDGIERGKTYQLVAGNTGKGVYPKDGPFDQYIDITGINELHEHTQEDPYLLIGGSVTLTSLMTILREAASADPVGYAYCSRLADHLQKVANTNVRNVGTIAGNLMLKHAHNDFESDVFNLLECVGAQISIMNSSREQSLHSPRDFLDVDMTKKIIYFISFPMIDASYKFWTFKVTPRNQNAKAYVNGAMLASVEEVDGGAVNVLSAPRIVLGGISSTFFHAETVEAGLVGKNLNLQSTLDEALQNMETDVAGSLGGGGDQDEYKAHLAKALLYKFFLFALGGNLEYPELTSSIGQLSWERNVPQSYQEYTQGDESEYPMYQPVTKLEGKVQCTGEAEYVDDIEPKRNELFAAYVIGEVANSDFTIGENLGEVLAMPGVKSFVSAANIPSDGVNSVSGTISTSEGVTNEEIFSSGRINYSGQAIGLIVADSYEHARSAAQNLEVEYTGQERPILSIEEALEEESATGKKRAFLGFSSKQGKRQGRTAKLVTGQFTTGAQYHFHMETQSCLINPKENGEWKVYASTQNTGYAQQAVAYALGIDAKVIVSTRRLGGGFGGKVYNTKGIVGACAVAANALNQPIRLILDLESNMKMKGRRPPYYFRYSATVDEDTLEVDTINVEVYCDVGFSLAVRESPFVAGWIQGSYSCNEYNLAAYDVVTNTPTVTTCRAPTSAQCHAFAETLMEHIAVHLGRDPLEVKMANLLRDGDPLFTFDGSGGYTTYRGTNPLPAMIAKLSFPSNGDYKERKNQVTQFNEQNAFRKRGIALVPLTWMHGSSSIKFTIQVTAYASDGSVAVTIGGIEMGQGLNTKVAQVIGNRLGIADISLISVRASDNFVTSNNNSTAGSYGSDACAQAASIACEKLLANMDEALGGPDEGPQSWPQRVSLASLNGADLTGRHQSNPSADGVEAYEIYGVCIAEAEVDILTGEKSVRRVDLMEDTGTSISPLVDLGQIEGGFVMGLGWWLTEEITYDPDTGALLNFDTWTYKPPSSQDIPENFRTYLHDTGTNTGVFSSKATGEPCLLMGFSVMLAVRNAIAAARFKGSEGPSWFRLDGPATNPSVQAATGVTSDDFYL